MEGSYRLSTCSTCLRLPRLTKWLSDSCDEAETVCSAATKACPFPLQKRAQAMAMGSETDLRDGVYQ